MLLKYVKLAHCMVFSVLILMSLACQLTFSQFSDTPTPKLESNDSQDILKNANNTIIINEDASGIHIEITQEQLTNIIKENLKSNPELSIDDPQVRLYDRKIQFQATAIQSNISLPVEIILTVQVNENSNLSFSILSAKIGSIPLPENLLVSIAAELEKAVDDQIISQIGDFRITSLIINDGKMVITGQRK